MDIMTRIQDLLKDRKKTQKELSAYLGIKQQVFSDWKANRNTSYMKRLPDIAAFFELSLDDFLNGNDPALAQTKQPVSNEDEPIDEVRRKLHAIIDTLSESDKEAMLFMAQSLMQRDKEKK